jgi:EAL domain-containing protein (putative c-di-GMP-specific phosphodiesterase class I)
LPKKETQAKRYEILLRMFDEQTKKLILPHSFLYAAERYNLIHLLDRWAIKKLLSNIGKSNLALSSETLFTYHINLSAATLNEQEFPNFLEEQFEQEQVLPNKICFEIKETFALTHLTQIVEFIKRFKTLGCSFALDNFGTGMSSFDYLKNLPVDWVKIYGNSIANILKEPIATLAVETIHRLVTTLGIQTIAECVYSEEIYHKLIELGIDCS